MMNLVIAGVLAEVMRNLQACLHANITNVPTKPDGTHLKPSPSATHIFVNIPIPLPFNTIPQASQTTHPPTVQYIILATFHIKHLPSFQHPKCFKSNSLSPLNVVI